ncbi:hypothetical protein KIN20_015363 [Parelaphostrongylus tenuis]|uniref:Uncharacterized protein n=1 Tax=Parelaphostrongylus tenuis TaxID=148309 RepID=A0AAD5MES0_PARTN|nr:hypothetical protein KIN20_015363 [Parelaphostrongylus tenuis]
MTIKHTDVTLIWNGDADLAVSQDPEDCVKLIEKQSLKQLKKIRLCQPVPLDEDLKWFTGFAMYFSPHVEQLQTPTIETSSIVRDMGLTLGDKHQALGIGVNYMLLTSHDFDMYKSSTLRVTPGFPVSEAPQNSD